jgi:hypothetical protein
MLQPINSLHVWLIFLNWAINGLNFIYIEKNFHFVLFSQIRSTMTSILLDDDSESIVPEQSISQQIEPSLASSSSKSKSDPESIGDYFVVKNIPECLEQAKIYLAKSKEPV